MRVLWPLSYRSTGLRAGIEPTSPSFLMFLLEPLQGYDPWSPAYQADALPLSYNGMEWVTGIEPASSSLEGWRHSIMTSPTFWSR